MIGGSDSNSWVFTPHHLTWIFKHEWITTLKLTEAEDNVEG
jgi:hypothetical protein